MSSGTSPTASTPDPDGAPIPIWDDPCAAYRSYRKAYDELITGAKVSRTEFHGNGQERHLEFAVANISRLKAEMEAAFNACQEKNGGQPMRRRFAIQAGYPPRRVW